jgi:hypothetical protein
MKKTVLSILAFMAISIGVNAQTWETVGTEGLTSGDTQYGCMDVYNGQPYIAYKDVANSSKCTVMRYNGTNWVYLGGQAFTSGLTREQSIAIDQQNGDVYVEYTDATINAIVVSRFNENNGTWEPLGQNGIASSPSEFYQQIKIDNGIPYLAFGGYQAMIKQYTASAWTGMVMSPSQAWYTRLAIDGTDKYIVYSDISALGKATVGKISTTGVSAVGGNFGFTTGGVGFTDIAVDNGTPYISFQDSLNGRKVSVMEFNGTTWEYLGGAGISGGNVYQTRILVHNSEPYIGYFDESDGNIHVKKWNGTTWESVGNAVSNGQIQLNDMIINDNHIFIAYRDGGALGGKLTVKKFNMNSTSNIDLSAKKKINIHPNPVQNNLFIELEDGEITEMSILDLSGKVVKSIANNNAKIIDVSDLQQGVYILKAVTNKGVSTKRFIKQ